jgi:hypothetical protein
MRPPPLQFGAYSYYPAELAQKQRDAVVHLQRLFRGWRQRTHEVVNALKWVCCNDVCALIGTTNFAMLCSLSVSVSCTRKGTWWPVATPMELDVTMWISMHVLFLVLHVDRYELEMKRERAIKKAILLTRKTVAKEVRVAE